MHYSLYQVFIMGDNRIWNLTVKMTTLGLSSAYQNLALLMLNNHIDVVILCCGLNRDSAVVDAVVGDRHDVRSEQRLWLVDAFVRSVKAQKTNLNLKKGKKREREIGRGISVWKFSWPVSSLKNIIDMQSICKKKTHSALCKLYVGVQGDECHFTLLWHSLCLTWIQFWVSAHTCQFDSYQVSRQSHELLL